jgi:hypothetical protein
VFDAQDKQPLFAFHGLSHPTFAYSERRQALTPRRQHRGVRAHRGGGRAALGEAAFTAAWAKGRAMSLDEAVQYALGED